MSLLDNLISYWKLDEASGNAIDSHSSNDLTENGSIGTASGKINNARDFERSDSDRFSAASNSELQTGDIDFSISLWINGESMGAAYYGIIGKDDIGVGREWLLLQDTDFADKFSFNVFSGTTLRGRVLWGTAPSTGTWYHLVAWHDATANEIGISVNNGTPVTESTTGALSASSAPFTIGSLVVGGTPNHHFDGLIDEVGFWKRVLTSGERTQLYNGGSGLSYDDFDGGGGGFVAFPRPRGLRAGMLVLAGGTL